MLYLFIRKEPAVVCYMFDNCKTYTREAGSMSIVGVGFVRIPPIIDCWTVRVLRWRICICYLKCDM